MTDNLQLITGLRLLVGGCWSSLRLRGEKYMTLKEIAEAAGITKAGATKRIESMGFSDKIERGLRGSISLPDDIAQLVIAYKPEPAPEKPANKSNSDASEVHTNLQLELLRQLEVKDKQLEVKDRQLEEQQRTIQGLTELLNQNLETISQLSLALTREQALHYGTQQQLQESASNPKSEQDEADPVDEQTVEQAPETENPTEDHGEPVIKKDEDEITNEPEQRGGFFAMFKSIFGK